MEFTFIHRLDLSTKIGATSKKEELVLLFKCP
jgi:hypothetical protein